MSERPAVEWTGPSGANNYDAITDQLTYGLLPEYQAWAMDFWDLARVQHTAGFGGTFYRETFESILEGHRENLQASLTEIARLREALEQCAEYFDDRADVDTSDGEPVANKEMRLLGVVREALGEK